MIRTYHFRGRGWDVVSNLPDLTVIATGDGTRFARRNGKIDPHLVIAETLVYPAHLTQPHAGPLLRYDSTWAVRGKTIKRIRRRLIPTPLAELDRLASLAQAGRRKEFDDAVPKSARARIWKLLQKKISVNCPNSDEFAECDTLSVWDDQIHERGSVHLTMRFQKRHGHWRLARLVD